MKKHRSHEKNRNRDRQLRADAEKKLAKAPGAFPEIKKKAPETLLHELQVHQIELEMQNEELRNTQIALGESRDIYVELYDFSPVGYFAFTREALIKEANLTGSALLGMERQKLINKKFRRFVEPGYAEQWDRHITSVFEKGKKHVCELALRREDGQTFYARLESIRIDASSGDPVIRTAMSDITELKQVEIERGLLIEKLQKALNEVKTLKGLIPMCSACKRISLGGDSWETIETYIKKHSQAECSHRLCPECKKILYPER